MYTTGQLAKNVMFQSEQSNTMTAVGCFMLNELKTDCAIIIIKTLNNFKKGL